MRRKIELWIGNLRADLADDSFILMNYTVEDLTSPAIVKNSFSRQITLPGTTANNRIFGEIFRNDRQTQYYGTNETGIHFDPTRKTTWRIYNERSEILDSGYLRLNGVKRKRNTVVEYKVTLYGGLGSFLYGLAYDDNGEKRTLADLDFLGTATPATELNFTLNAAAVKAAWTRIAQATGTPSQLWDIINFAPAYNGKPGGTFDADKGLLDVVACGIAHDATGTVGGIALVELAKEYTEWQTKDLRSYLQRPVVRLRSIIEAICASRNNNGWSVALDGQFFNASNPYWQKTWMTLPIIDTENIISDDGGSGTLTWSQVGGDASVVEATIPNAASDKFYTIDIRIRPVVQLAASQSGTLNLHCEDSGTNYMSYVQYLVNAYNASNTLVASTAVRVSSRQPAAEAGDVPQMDAVSTFTASGTAGSWNGSQLAATVSGRGISRIRVTATTVALKWGATSANTPDGNAMWTNPLSYASLVSASKYHGDYGGGSYAYSDIDGGRSGKNITKAILLSGGGTPADYLLALCKTFGLMIVADGATKTVSIEKRSTFYQDTVVDITDRIDMDEGFDKEPFAFDAKWYDWAAKYESGEWAKSYAEKYGRTFGQQRVDTGYSFDANTNAVMDSAVFRGAVMALENAKYYCGIVEGGHSIPSVLLDRGAKYNITASATSTEEVDINLPSESAEITWMNTANPSYDLFPKPQFHDKDDAAFDERDTLLFFDGMTDFGVVLTEENITDQFVWVNKSFIAGKSNPNYSVGGYYTLNDGRNSGNEAYIDISRFYRLRITLPQMADADYVIGGAFYDAQYNLISGIWAAGASPAGMVENLVDVPAGAKYIRTTWRTNYGNFSCYGLARIGSSPYTLTDDTQQMLTMNGGTPCWLLQWTDVDGACAAPALPKFSRYLDYTEQHQGYVYERSLDFGTPAEVPIPGITFRDGATIWPAYWANYIADRYDDDSAVVRCKVNLAGMQVGPALLRQFYWFDGAVWALNRIINHSMTTWDLTECEFVKVQDIDNYTE